MIPAFRSLAIDLIRSWVDFQSWQCRLQDSEQDGATLRGNCEELHRVISLGGKLWPAIQEEGHWTEAVPPTEDPMRQENPRGRGHSRTFQNANQFDLFFVSRSQRVFLASKTG